MSLSEITRKVNGLGNAWEQFKQVNDARLNEVEKKGAADPLYMEHLKKISDSLDNYKSRMDHMETAISRPEAVFESKSVHVPSEYSVAFQNYLRKGMDSGLESFQAKSLSVGNNDDGGFLVTSAMSETIAKTVAESCPMRQVASIETISTDSLDVIQDYDEMEAGWTTETGTVSDGTTAKINKAAIDTFELYAQPKATQKLIDDAAIDIELWISQKVSEIFAKEEGKAFISGNGTTAPKGILTYAAGTEHGEIEQIDSGTSAQVTADGIVQLYYSLKDAYASNAHFMMNRSVIQSVRLLKESATGQYLWNPGLTVGTPDTLLGVPVLSCSEMPAATAGSLSVALADFAAAYKIVDRIGIRTLRDPFTDKPFVKFYTTKRVGGAVVNSEAIKLLKLDA